MYPEYEGSGCFLHIGRYLLELMALFPRNRDIYSSLLTYILLIVLFKQNSLQFLNAEMFFTFKNDMQMFMHISDYIHTSNKSATSLSTQSASGRIHNLWNIKSIGTEDYVQEERKAL